MIKSFHLKRRMPSKKACRGMQNAGFSLVEMLMALLVASLLLAALAPVMTRRAANETVTVGSSGGAFRPAGQMNCWYTGSPNMVDSDGNTRTLSEEFDFMGLKNIGEIGIILVSGGGGGAAASQKNPETKTYSSGQTPLTITADMDDFRITTMTGGGGGGGGGAGKYTLDNPVSKSYCESLSGTDTTGHSNYATYDSVGKICVTKYNQVSNPTTYKTYLTTNYNDTNCTSNYTHNNCDDQQRSVTYAYSGCNRPVCTYAGAVAACAKLKQKTGYDWQVPTTQHGQDWDEINYTGHYTYYDLALCSEYSLDSSASHPVPLCKDSTNTIYTGYLSSISTTTTEVKARPQRFWSYGSHYAPESGRQTGLGLTYGVTWLGGSGNEVGSLLSVRCELDIQTEDFTPLPGGQGGNAPSIQNLTSENSGEVQRLNEVIKNNIGGTIEFETGAGGKGAAKITKKDTRANDADPTEGKGKPSCIIVKKDGVEKFRLCVMGGNPGGGANGAASDVTGGKADGAGGAAIKAADGCYTIDSTVSPAVTTKFSCSAAGSAGLTGTAGTLLTTTQINSGTVANGKTNTTVGKGGGGGYAFKTDSTTGGEAALTFGKGGDGGSGNIQMSYKINFNASGGGGGGGGYVAHITNVPVSDETTCQIHVGAGGQGATSANEDGTDGGYSSVVCSNNSSKVYKVTGGKGGLHGTAGVNSQGGTGGEPGGIDSASRAVFEELVKNRRITTHAGTKGLDGGDISDEGSASNFKELVRSAGGRGGASGTGTSGACGALSIINKGGCSLITVDSNNEISPPLDQSETSKARMNGVGFAVSDIDYPTKDTFNKNNPVYFEAGAGGGGGAWHMGMPTGKGGNGQGGYVCIYWDDPPR